MFDPQIALATVPEHHRTHTDLTPISGERAAQDARVSIARAIFREGERQDLKFSVAKYLHRLSERAPIDPIERVMCERAADRAGQSFNRDRAWMPFGCFDTRDLTVAQGSKGGYLVGAETVEPVDVLRPWSVTASAGVQILSGLQDQVIVPTLKTPPAVAWLAGEAASATPDTAAVFGQASASPKTVVALVKISRQLLRQGAAAERFIRAIMMRALGEELDRMVMAGAGGAQPVGLLNTSGIGTQSGGTLAHAGLLAMRKAVLNAGAIEDRLAWVGTPAVQEVLAGRQRFTDASTTLWEGRKVLDSPAYATKNAATGALAVGDWSQAIVTVWGPGMQVAADPTQDFTSGGIALRVMLFCDVVFVQPAAFAVATSVT